MIYESGPTIVDRKDILSCKKNTESSALAFFGIWKNNSTQLIISLKILQVVYNSFTLFPQNAKRKNKKKPWHFVKK